MAPLGGDADGADLAIEDLAIISLAIGGLDRA